MKKFKCLISSILVVLLCLNNILFTYSDITLENSLTTNISNKIDSSLLGKEETETLLSVYIWCSDINYDTVEATVKQRIGYTEQDVSYLNSNEIGIIDIADKVDNYIATKRQVSKELYQTKLNGIVEELGILDKVIFVSRYAPMILAELTYEEIEAVCQNENVVEVGLHSIETEETTESASTYSLINTPENFYQFIGNTESEESFTQYIVSTGVTAIKNKSGLSGEGVKIGMLEDSTFINFDLILPSTRCHALGDLGSYDAHIHANRVATIMCGELGVASDAILYSYNYIDSEIDGCYFKQIENLLDLNVKVINMSMEMFPEDIGTNISIEWTNHIISKHNVSLVGAAGNDGENNGQVIYPMISDNAIAVGACDNNDNSDKTDDSLRAYSSYNDANGVIKPDIVASDNVFENSSGNGGTSYATPLVTGTIALMLECRPTLALYPEVIKAIVMASCHNKAIGYEENMFNGLTDRQGAGVFDPYMALAITSNGNYGYGVIDSNNTEKKISFSSSPYDSSCINVSMSWLNSAENSLNDERNNLDLELSINNLSAKKSENILSSTEMLYSSIYLSRNFDSEIDYEVSCYYNNLESDLLDDEVRFGYAWSFDAEEYKIIEQYEGVYFIKNKATNKYLTYDWENSNLLLNDYVGHYYNDFDQLMLISKNPTGNYVISDAFEYGGGLKNDGLNVVHDSVYSDINISQDEFGDYIFTCGSNYLSSNGGLKFASVDEISDSEKWILEEVVYKMGDIDCNGSINSTDSSYLYGFVSEIYTPTNVEMFLADMTGDGELDNNDELELYDAID